MTALSRKTGLRRTGRIQTSPERRAQKRIEKDLDQLARELIVVIRDRNTCQRCGATAERSKIDWSHVVTRAAKSIRWVEWNSKALCAGCHKWWGSHPVDAGLWWTSKFPDRAILYGSWRRERRHKVNYELTRHYLIQALDQAIR